MLDNVKNWNDFEMKSYSYIIECICSYPICFTWFFSTVSKTKLLVGYFDLKFYILLICFIHTFTFLEYFTFNMLFRKVLNKKDIPNSEIIFRK